MYISDDLVASVNFTHSYSIMGCCGMGHLVRLRSSNVTLRNKLEDRKIWAFHPKSQARELRLHQKAFTILAWMNELRLMTDTIKDKQPTFAQASISTRAFAVPKEIAFAAVLESMMRAQQAIYILTDNVSGSGDVCHSHFTPRGFAKWAMYENMGTIVTTGPIKSMATTANIQGWFFTPNWGVLRTTVQQAREWLTEDVKNANQEGTLQERYERNRRVTADKVTALSRRLTASW